MFHLSFETLHLLSDKNLNLRVYFKGNLDKFTQFPYVAISLGNLAVVWLQEWLAVAKARQESDKLDAPFLQP